MSTRIPKDEALTEVDRLVSFIENRLGADFKVGPTGLTEAKAIFDALLRAAGRDVTVIGNV